MTVTRGSTAPRYGGGDRAVAARLGDDGFCEGALGAEAHPCDGIDLDKDREEGRLKRRPGTLHAEMKYDTPLNRFYLAKKRIVSQIKDHPGKRKPGRPRLFDEKAYGRVRSSVERFNAWVKSFRRVATRYERLPPVYMGFVHLACIVIYLRILQ